MNHKTIILIAPPRSLSTAFLRMMAARNDLTILNEPSCCVFNQIHYPHSRWFYNEHAHTNYNQVKKAIQLAGKQSNVFIKEMSFSFEELIIHEPELISAPSTYFIFLLRDPHHCMLSYYKKISQELADFIMLDLERLTGFHSLYTVFKTLKNKVVNSPYFIHAEDLCRDPMNTIEAFCKHLNIPHNKDYLSWNKLGEQFTGINEWQEHKKSQFAQHWHHEAISSQTFHQPTQYDTDENNLPTFTEITHPSHKKTCMQVYQANKIYYDFLQQQLIEQAPIAV